MSRKSKIKTVTGKEKSLAAKKKAKPEAADKKAKTKATEKKAKTKAIDKKAKTKATDRKAKTKATDRKAKTEAKSKKANAAKAQRTARPLPKTLPAKLPGRKVSASTSAATAATASQLSTLGITPYKRKKNEVYMSDEQLAHFRRMLDAWKLQLMTRVDNTLHHLRDDAENFPDSNDRATQEAEFGLELKTRDRERKLIRKIDLALERIAQGTYGYCDETGEEIGLGRLEARPIATLCVEAQERHEQTELHFNSQTGES
ncbi:MAG: RNA polymerase-binding protein DksA [Pseudomonadota bacterium]